MGSYEGRGCQGPRGSIARGNFASALVDAVARADWIGHIVGRAGHRLARGIPTFTSCVPKLACVPVPMMSACWS